MLSRKEFLKFIPKVILGIGIIKLPQGAIAERGIVTDPSSLLVEDIGCIVPRSVLNEINEPVTTENFYETQRGLNGWVGCGNGEMYYTNDGGCTWSRVDWISNG